MTILGIDPGYAIVGYGVLSYSKNSFSTKQYGVIRTSSKEKIDIRLLEIFNDITEILEMHKPDAVAIEKLFFNTNQKTVIDVSQARGVLMLAAANAGVPIFEYTPLQVKMAVVGYGRAEKNQVMEMTKTILNLSKIPKPDDAADALAIAICHAHSHKELKLK